MFEKKTSDLVSASSSDVVFVYINCQKERFL